MYFKQKTKNLIAHMDADAFFASCEVARNPKLLGKPIVVGADRGIASAFSYEAKALGVTRAMPIFQVKQKFPQAIIKASDYALYRALSRRIYLVVKRHIDVLDVYGIDEAFFEIPNETKNPWAFLKKLQDQILIEVGVPVSFGAGKTKTLAKQASKYNKPRGVVVLEERNTKRALSKIPIGDVWGIGKQTSKKLLFYGVTTALEFTAMPEIWVRCNFSLPIIHIWHELKGIIIHRILENASVKNLSITSSRTFLEKTNNPEIILQKLSKNIELASLKARKVHKTTSNITIFLKQKDLTITTKGILLPVRTNHTHEILKHVIPVAKDLLRPGIFYRTTGVTFENLLPDIRQQDLFGETKKHDNLGPIYKAVDEINKKIGSKTVYFGASARRP